MQITASSGRKFSAEWNDNFTILKNGVLYVNALVENANGEYFKENTPHELFRIKKTEDIKPGSRSSLASVALSSGGANRAESGQAVLYTGTVGAEYISVSFITTDTSTYKVNVTGAVILR